MTITATWTLTAAASSARGQQQVARPEARASHLP